MAFPHGEREVYVAVGSRCPFASAAEEHDRLDLGCPLGPGDDRIPLFLCELHVTTIAPNCWFVMSMFEGVITEESRMEDRIKQFFESDFDPGQSQSSTGQAETEERIANALEYIAYQLGQINRKMRDGGRREVG